MKKPDRLIRVALAVLLVAALGGCSFRGKGDKGTEGALSESDLDAQREGRYGTGAIPTAEGEGVFHDIHFDFDSAHVTLESRSDIEYNARILREQPELKIQLEGHTDERGTAEYNLTLGNERARAVRDVLVSLGIPSSRLATISYGEEVPLDPGHEEGAWSKNRRVHFTAYRELPERQ